MLSLSNISKGYHQHEVLHDISFSLQKNKILGVMGPNGAGKTTLLKIISLILKPDSGQVFLNNQNALQESQALRPLIGYVPQDLALYEDLSVLDNLHYWSERPLKEKKSHFESLLSHTGLTELRNKRVNTLSGGMKRRLNLAIALINEPKLLIMDEPLVGMDIAQIHSMHHFLRVLSDQGVTQIISSHNAHHLLSLADEVLLLNQGKVCFLGTREAFLNLSDNDFSKVDETILKLIAYQEEH